MIIGNNLDHPIYAGFLSTPLGFLAGFFLFTRFANTAAFSSIEGQLGAGASVLMSIRRGFVTTPALIIVGFLMMTQIKGIDWDDFGIAIPAFLIIILMPFTYNISVGIGAGFVSYVVIRLFQGRTKEIHPLMWLVSGLFMVYFLQSPINIWTA